MENNRTVTLINYLSQCNGDIEYYDYECKGYGISVRNIYGTTELAIIKYPTHFTPTLTYSKTNGTFVDWRETVGSDWHEFVQEVQKVHEIVQYFEENLEMLKQGIIPGNN